MAIITSDNIVVSLAINKCVIIFLNIKSIKLSDFFLFIKFMKLYRNIIIISQKIVCKKKVNEFYEITRIQIRHGISYSIVIL